MSNERLGIFEELQARRERYSDHAERKHYHPYIPPQQPEPKPAIKPAPRLPVVHPERRTVVISARRTIYPEAALGRTMYQVVRATSEESDTDVRDMLGPRRTQRFTRPRQVAMYMISRYCPHISYPTVGITFNRDHTTIIHAGVVVSERVLAGDAATVELVNRVHARLQAIV